MIEQDYRTHLRNASIFTQHSLLIKLYN